MCVAKQISLPAVELQVTVFLLLCCPLKNRVYYCNCKSNMNIKSEITFSLINAHFVSYAVLK